MRTSSLLLLLCVALPCASRVAADQPNVLFIAIDDMNDWTGFLGGHPQTLTPNLDRLARRGVNFTNAHCPAPACSPCRNAVLLGIEPFHSGLYPFYNLNEVPDDLLASCQSLPGLFRRSGYRTFGAGKVFHDSHQLPDDWDDYLKQSGAKLAYQPSEGYQQGKSRKMAFCPTTNPDRDHPDHQVAGYGVDVLSRDHSKPFFLAVGIVKPHLAFVCPQRFFDRLPAQITPPPILANDHDDIPWAGRAMSRINDDLRFRRDRAWNDVRRAYLACIAWADYNVGRVLDALQASPYSDNTIVVLWSDHGYHLGEKRSFRKFSLWEEATRVPFIIDDRRQKPSEGRECSEGVSLVNLYRTLSDLAGIDTPDYVDGYSLQPMLRDPSAPAPEPAITTWGRGNYSARDARWRYTRYFDGGEELYDHTSDPNEWTNLACSAEYAAEKQRLAESLPTRAEEAPLVRKGISLWNVVDADQPDLGGVRKRWEEVRETLRPPLAE